MLQRNPSLDLVFLGPKRAKFIESNKITDILSHCRDGSCVVLDLDNTVMESTLELGSDQWFEWYLNVNRLASKCRPSIETDVLVLAIYHGVQHLTKMQLVEPEIIELMKQLQAKDITVLGLTARGREIIVPTLRQLQEVGIEFQSKMWDKNSCNLTLGGNSDRAYYRDGIIFCSGLDKGECLNAFFKLMQYRPRHLIMADDKLRHLRSVSAIMQQGDFTGLHYSYLDEKVKQFEKEGHKKTEAQLASIYHSLSDQAKSALNKLKIDVDDAADRSLSSQGLFKLQNSPMPCHLLQAVDNSAKARKSAT